jgi:hypothetical protein
MRRAVFTVAAASTVLLAACGGGEVIVQAQLEAGEGQVTPLAGLPVRALPYDRDAVFDSLRAAYATPEPEIPAELAMLQDSMARAQEAWRTAESRWRSGRDSLRALQQRLDNLSRASGEYVVAFRQFNELETQVNAAERTMNQQFGRYESLQTRYTDRAAETSRARDQWADAAYSDIERAIAERLQGTRRTEAVDTTNANGIGRLSRLQAGQWWIHARYDLPFEELYWNVPVTVDGEQVQVQLTRETAQVRPKL